MSEQRPIFSESWHRVAGQRLSLRPSVSIRRQRFRGDLWHVAQDGFTNAFFRFRPEAYDFIARLDGTKTVEEIWLGCLERAPETAPGQGEIVSMLAQLYQSNLLASDTPADTAQLFVRHQKRIKQELASQIFGIFFLRIRLLDPDRFLNRAWPWMRWLATPYAAGAWGVLLVLGLSAVFGNWDRALDQSQGVLAPGNLLLLYAAFTVAKLIHEFGHAFMVKAFGGEVHAMGVTLLVFTPIPYVDATAAWAFRERWKRVMVGLGGMIPELAYAGVAALIWAGTAPGMLNSLAYNTMIVASVSTVIFNLNPLLRFDGYYILADLTESPNLQPRAGRQWLHLLENYGFGVRVLESPARSRREAVWLTIYGVVSWAYRIVITVTIILLVADRYFGLGLLAGLVTFIGAFVMPVVKSARYLVREPRIERQRQRAWAVTAGLAALVVLLLGVVPFPRHFRAPGLVRAAGSMDVYTPVSGWVADKQAPSSTTVAAGQPLVRMESAELEFSLVAARADLEQVKGRERQMVSTFPAGIEPMHRSREAAEAKLARLEADKVLLELRAPVAGRWVAPQASDWDGLFFPRGTRLGEVVGKGPGWEFLAVVSQEYASELFGAAGNGAEVRFPGVAGTTLSVAQWHVVPGRQETLPSPALGWAASGPVKVRSDDPHGVRTEEPFFLVVGQILPPTDGAGVISPDAAVLWQGRTGLIRFDLTWSPLAVRWVRQFRQLLQERYQL